jgi:cation diffusion facilitator CzcD-associated flavoprotein CzcO
MPSWAVASQEEAKVVPVHQLADADCASRHVVVVGAGPYAVEAVSACIRAGAASVTMLARRPHAVVPRCWFESPVLTRLFWRLAAGGGATHRRLAILASVAVYR